MTGSTLLQTGPQLWIVLAVLVSVGAVVTRTILGLGPGEVLVSAVRAVVQLAAVALLITQLGSSIPWACGFLLVMVLVAAWTVKRRVGGHTPFPLVLVPLLAGAAPPVLLMLGTGVLPWQPLALVAVAGQLIGGCMAATNLAGRRMNADLLSRRGEVEAALALGFLPRAARSMVARPVASEALMPALDQTKTVGMVTLPGAFVGLILGGASPVDAGLVQLLVLVSLVAAQALSITVMAFLTEAGLTGPEVRRPGAVLPRRATAP